MFVELTGAPSGDIIAINMDDVSAMIPVSGENKTKLELVSGDGSRYVKEPIHRILQMMCQTDPKSVASQPRPYETGAAIGNLKGLAKADFA